jgi:hypothetical protein
MELCLALAQLNSNQLVECNGEIAIPVRAVSGAAPPLATINS